MLCIEAIPKHKAYGMLFPEYRKRRESVLEEDTTERKRLSFYIPEFPSAVSVAYSLKNQCSYHRYILLTIELGLIKFQYDYHDIYSSIKAKKSDSFDKATTIANVEHYMHMIGSDISLGSAIGYRNSKGKHLTPTVPEWLYNAIADISTYMGMTMSDVAFLSLCIGIRNSTPDEMQNEMVQKYCKEVVNRFDMKIKHYETVIDIYSQQLDK